MNLQPKNCYDVFNDYLGLSNVVGSQEESCYWMHRVIGCDGDSRISCLGMDSDCQKLSDVERLFGRGAVLHKSGQDSPSRDLARLSPGSANRSCNASPTTQLSNTGTPIPFYQADYKDKIEKALDAILQKYSYLQKPCLQSAQLKEEFGAPYESCTTLQSNQLQRTMDMQDIIFQATRDLQNSGFPRFATKATLSSSTTARFIGCSFCKNNKEVKDWYMSHQLKDSMGRVTCPVLRSYECPLCDATGDSAHTIGHCPQNPNRHSSLPLAVRSKANATGKKKSL